MPLCRQALQPRGDPVQDLTGQGLASQETPGIRDQGCDLLPAFLRVHGGLPEWQAIMDHLRDLPVKTKGELPTIPDDARAAEVRAIRAA